MKIENHKDLIVWQKSMNLATKVLKALEKFSSDQKFGMVQQMNRSCISIPSNISEGFYRMGAKTYTQFLRISKGSLAELETQIIISRSLNYFNEKEFKEMIKDLTEVAKMLSSMINKLEK